MATVETGVITTNLLPESLRVFYEKVLLDTPRSKTIYRQFATTKYDVAARDAKQVTFTEVFDLHPAIGTLSEAVPFVEGAYLDGEQTTIAITEHGNTIKTNAFHATVQYWNSGNFRSLVREKLGWNLADSVDIMARNAFLTTTNVHYSDAGAGAAPTTRATIAADDVYLPDYGDQSRTNLESRDALGVDEEGSIVAIVHPRQARDIRKNSSEFIDIVKYAKPVNLLRGEIGMLDGVRYVKSNRAKLPNAGATVAQLALDAASVKGQGGPNSDNKSLLKYVQLPAASDLSAFAVGQEVTIHDHNLGTAVLETDPTAEHRVIVQVDDANDRLYFDRPLFLAHSAGNYVTEARDVYAVTMMAGPGVVWAVGLMPQVIVPLVIDDFGRIFRLSWYGIFDFHCYRPDFTEVWYTAASTADYGVA
jgi:N4-gp56 family major capsid protein